MCNQPYSPLSASPASASPSVSRLLMPSVPLTSALTAPLSSSQTPPYESTEHYAEHTGGIQCVSVYYESSAVIQDPQNLAPLPTSQMRAVTMSSQEPSAPNKVGSSLSPEHATCKISLFPLLGTYATPTLFFLSSLNSILLFCPTCLPRGGSPL